MDINLLTAVKRRVMYELRSAINEHYNFKGTEVYHKFPYTERPDRGVVLRNASSSRIKLSPDDFAYTLKSYVGLARAENHPGRFLDWVWESRLKTTARVDDEDLSSQIDGTATNGTNRFFYTQYKPILAGWNNDAPADNFRQVDLTLNGDVTHAEFLDGARGMIVLPMAPVVGDTLKVGYYRSTMSAPGRYYVQIIDSPFVQVIKETVIDVTTGIESTAGLNHTGLYGTSDVLYLIDNAGNKTFLTRGTDYTITSDGAITFLLPLPVGSSLFADYQYLYTGNKFAVDPLLQVKDEEVIEVTTGTELTETLEHSGLYGDFDVLYLTKGREDDRITLEKGTDYSITTGGVVTFLQPLSVGYSLFANYRYVAPTMGPFPVPDSLHYDDTSIPGVVLCFNKQIEVGDKLVVIIYPDRQIAASVYSGHYRMTFDIEAFSRHPEESSEMADQIIHEIWGNRRVLLVDEGLTLEEFDPTGESEEAYDTNTGDLYYRQSLSMQMITEWKRYVPTLWDIEDYDLKLYEYLKTSKYIVTPDNKVLELQISPVAAEFEVVYPKVGYPKYI